MKAILGLLLLLVCPAIAEAVTRYVQASAAGGCAQGSTNYIPGSNSCSGAAGSGATVYVASSQSNLNTALAATNAGDSLLFRAGTYNLKIDGNIAALKAGTSWTNAVTFAAYPGNCTSGCETATFTSNDGNNIVVAVTSGATPAFRYVIFDGLAFNGSDVRNGQSNVAFGGTPLPDHIRFINVRSYNNSANWTSLDRGAGFYVAGDDHEFINITADGNGAGATSLGGTNAPYGFYMSTGNRNLIERSRIYNNGAYGIHGYYSGGGVNNHTYRYNTVYNNGVSFAGAGILISSGSGNAAYSNVVYGNYIGMYTNYGCTNCKFYNNTVYNNQHYGVEIGTSTGSGLEIKNNIFQNNPDANIQNDGGAAPDYAANICSAAGTGCSVPLEAAATTFVIPGSNFNLKAGSQAISGGVPFPDPFNRDLAGLIRPQGTGWDRGAYEYTGDIPAPAVSQLVLALPLDEGSGSIAADVSGQKNNATLVGGATWDNAGKYGKAIALDGTGYLNIPASATLALAPSMTLEAWIYPTSALSGFATVIRHDRYYLYGASDAGYCPAPALAPLGGYAGTVDNYICATSLPPLNQWSHLAVTHDGTTMIFYLNGNIIASRTSTDPMTPASYNVTIGASAYGENFIGKIDQPQVYTYARTQAQIQSDMNTSLTAPPGKYVEIAAPASVEISAASSIEIAAD